MNPRRQGASPRERVARASARRPVPVEAPRSVALYFTVLVPFSDAPTAWHPTDRTGPFSVLTRGAFKTEQGAHDWARAHLAGQPYSVKQFEGA